MEKTRIKQYVGRAVIMRNGKILLVNKKGEPHHFLPGGRLEDNEGLRDCVRREIKEELGKEAVVGEFIGCIEHRFETETKEYYEVGFYYATAVDNLPTKDNISNEDELQFKWVEITNPSHLDVRPPPVVDLLKQLANQTTFTAYWASTVE